jgi:hypothetical protein
MFRDQQNYRAVAFRAPHIEELGDLTCFFPPRTVTKAEQTVPSSRGFEVMHCYYWSPDQFTRAEIPSEFQKRVSGVRYYRYNMYFFQTSSPKGKVFFVALPFLRMALDVYPRIKDAARGTGIRYQTVDLEALLKAVKQNRHLDGAITITRARFKVAGDELTDTLLVSGQDVPHSGVVRTVFPAMDKLSIAAKAERLRLSVAGTSLRFNLELDDAGHYKFWLAKNAYNLPAMAVVMPYLHKEGLVAETTSFPYMRSLREEEEEQDDG